MGHRTAPLIRSAPLMGTVASIHIFDDQPDGLIDDAIATFLEEMERLEAMFSTFRPTSEISRINAGELHLLDASAEVIEVLDACTSLEHLSNGAFTVHPIGRSPTDPAGFIDPAGFVKGWATERSSERLTAAQLQHWYVGVGGDVQTHGRPSADSPFSVAIADPNQAGNIVVVLDVADDHAVATSGIAQRGNHIWSRSPASHRLASITVAGPHLTWADAYATAAFAMGDDGVQWISDRVGYEAFAVRLDGSHVTTL